MESIKPKILITGGLGFIFSHVTEYFVAKGWDVVVIDNLSVGSHPEIVDDSFSIFNMHVQDCLDLIIKENPDYIIHAAAISDVDYSIKNPLETTRKNNNATTAVFEAARECSNLKKLLYVSTDEVYGECDHPKTEEEIIFPRNPYALSKAYGSLLRLTYDNTYPELKDKTCETRFCNVFGPRQDDRKVLPAIKRAVFGGESLQLHNGGEGYRQFIHVSEIPPILDMLLEKGTRTYNITSGVGYTVKELIDLTEQLTGMTVPTIESHRPGMDTRYEMSGERIYKEFGWGPQKTFRETFKEYLES